MPIRHATAEDLPALQEIVAATEMFPPEMLPDMIAGFLDGASDEIWHVHATDPDGDVTGFSYTRAEPLTEGTWNMLALAVHPARQSTGVGRRLTEAVEAQLRANGARVLIVDTSGSDNFAGARSFYGRCGYTEEARIRDYWAAGDDKVTFRKLL